MKTCSWHAFDNTLHIQEFGTSRSLRMVCNMNNSSIFFFAFLVVIATVYWLMYGDRSFIDFIIYREPSFTFEGSIMCLLSLNYASAFAVRWMQSLEESESRLKEVVYPAVFRRYVSSFHK